MNNQLGINFDEARETLGKLEQYVTQKIAQKNASTQNDMNLATQPQFEGDHLGEETPLTPVMPEGSVKANDQMGTELLDSVSTAKEASETLPMEQMNQNSATDIPAMGVDNNIASLTQAVPQPAVQAQDTYIPAMEAEVNNNTPALQGSELDKVDFTNVPDGMGIDLATNTPVSQTIDEPVSPLIAEPVSPVMDQSVMSASNTTAPVSSGVDTVNNAPAPEALPQQPQPLGETASKEVSGLEAIPDIDLSGAFTQSANNAQTQEEGYKAVNNTSTVGYTTTPVPEATPVVMPNGTTQDMAAAGSVVVGPEAFSMTR